jgi:hypothetical protein
MCGHDGWIYVGNAVWTVFLKWASDLQLRYVDRDLLDNYIEKAGGFGLWRSRDGVRWFPVTRNGMGNPYNLGIRSMASTPYGFFFGTANSFGPEMAVRRHAGWVYEENRRSGLEVWFQSDGSAGASSDRVPQPAAAAAASAPRAIPPRRAAVGAPLLGLWRSDMPKDDDPLRCLVEEVLALAPATDGSVVLFGNSADAAAPHVARRFTADRITALIPKGRWSLPRAAGPVHLLPCRLPELPRGVLWSGAIALEFFAGCTRVEELFANLFRRLAGEAWVVGAECLHGEPADRVRRARRKAPPLLTRALLENALAQAGFTAVRIEPVPDRWWIRAHRRRAERALEHALLNGGAAPAERTAAVVEDYVLFAARKQLPAPQDHSMSIR